MTAVAYVMYRLRPSLLRRALMHKYSYANIHTAMGHHADQLSIASLLLQKSAEAGVMMKFLHIELMMMMRTELAAPDLLLFMTHGSSMQ